MTRSARRFVERRAEASSGPAVFPAENVSSPRASFSGDAGRFSPGTAGGRFGDAESPRDDSASPGRTTRLDYYPDDIVPTPRRGDDVSSDEGIHPNDDPSSPMWHAASHRSPLAFSSRGQSSWLFAERETFETTRSSPSATARRPAIPRAGGMLVAPGPHADVLPRRIAARTGAFAGAGAPSRAPRPEDDVDPAPAFRRARAETRETVFPERKRKPPRAAGAPRGFARPTPTTASSWASPARARRARAQPIGDARGAPDRGTFSRAMRDAETMEAVFGSVGGARARLAALAGDVFFDAADGSSGTPNATRDGPRDAALVSASRVTRRSEPRGARSREKRGAERRVAFFRHASAPVVPAADRRGWLTGHASPAMSNVVALFRRDGDRDRVGRTSRARGAIEPAAGSAARVAARAAAAAFGSERRAAAATAERRSSRLARSSQGSDGRPPGLETKEARFATKTPLRSILARDPVPGPGPVGGKTSRFRVFAAS